MRETLARCGGQIIPMKMIPNLVLIESMSVNAVLTVTLIIAASANAICLLAYI